jgi:glycerol-3-phosphate acyltransferase PlsY
MPDPMGGLAYSWPLIVAALGGYLLGSIPFGLLLTKAAGLGDIRAVGSGNIGATNVLRTGRKGIALATLLLDGAKGATAVLIAAHFGLDAALMAGAGAVVGHVFPVWLRFRGGRGVATAFGVLLAVSWPAGLAALVTWAGAAAVTRYSSLAAILGMIAAPFYIYYWAGPQEAEWAAALALLVIARHWSNIRRLVKGEEPKIGRSKPGE